MDYKRLRAAWTVILFLGFSVWAGGLKAQTIDFGVTTGVNISTHTKMFRYHGNNSSLSLSPAVEANFQIGTLVRTNINQYLRIQAEPSAVMLGARYDGTNKLGIENIQTSGRTKLLYLQMPLLIQLSTKPSNKRKVYGLQFISTTYHLSAGLFGGYLLDSRFTGTNAEGSFSYDINRQYSNFDGGLMLGFGLERGDDEKMGFEVRGMYSLFSNGSGSDAFFRPQNLAASLAVYYIL